MEVIKLFNIDELAQDFIQPPRVKSKEDITILIFDYEMENGEYGEKGIYFKNVIKQKHTPENKVEGYMIKAYNSVGEVKDSSWLKENELYNEYKHYIAYFDGFGAYEFICLEVCKDID